MSRQTLPIPVLDPFAVDLTAMGLIEASAGTGKTYTITSLYLRLLLEQDLLPEQILVMTFAEAATRELKDRIRCRLSECHALFQDPVPVAAADHDPFLLELLRRHGDDPNAKAKVVNALRSHDLAAIHTIHGFCHRVLQESAFESGVLFDVEPLADDGELLQQVIDDFWRRHAPSWPAILHATLYALGCNVDSLCHDLRPVLSHIRFNGPASVLSGATAAPSDFAGAVDQLIAVWTADHEIIRARLDPGLLLKSKDRGNYRPETIALWCDEIDRYCRCPGNEIFPMEAVRQVSTSQLRLGTKKNKATPQHRFFDLAESLISQLEQAYRWIRQQCIDDCLARMPEVKNQQRLMSYDDMLTLVRDGLLARPHGRALVERLRRQYPVALIDEFQDTDPVQYAIFSTLYADESGGAPGLFLIGDPKQAIYSFRGADIFAYLQAAAMADRRYALSINYRSEPGLIRAVNLLFGSRDHPFLLADLAYPKVHAPERQSPLLHLEAETGAPMIVWTFAQQDNRQAAKRMVAAGVAGEIRRLIHLGLDGRARMGETPLAAGDIAVLVRSHKDGDLLRAALRQQGVRSVSYSQASVFKTDDAREIGLILAAVLNPWNSATLRAALTTSMLGWSATALQRLDTDESLWGEVISRFDAYRDNWHGRGVAVMLQRLGQTEGVFQRLAAYIDGDRRLTNLRHLLELLQEAAHQHGYGPAELIQWFDARRHDAAMNLDEEQLRLESDEHLVKIVTIHKSKGLEYPVVFYPFPWEGPPPQRTRDGAVVFHDARRRPMLDLDSPARQDHARQQQTEALAEEMRLLYVALTRARHRCYLTCGRVIVQGSCLSATSPLGMLLHPVDPGAEEDLAAALKAQSRGLDDASFVAPLHRIAAQTDGAMMVAPLPRTTADNSGSDALGTASTALGPALHCSRSLATTSMVFSFSLLHQLEARADEAPDHDGLPGIVVPEPTRFMGREDERSAFTFPRGARAGSCLHRMLEMLDFGELQHDATGSLVADTLRAFGFDVSWAEPVRAWLIDVLRTPLDPALPGFCLERLQRRDRLDELEFYYTMMTMAPTALRQLFVGKAPPAASPTAAAGGSAPEFMKGFIDLVCRFDGRYFIIDYKSNFLGSTRADYNSCALGRAMAEAGYDLQYHIYTVALHRFLAARIPGYDYDRHFGGVYYLFLRGMQPTGADGVFRARPDRTVIERLDARLGTGHTGAANSRIKRHGGHDDGR